MLLALGVVDYTLHRPWRLFVLLIIVLYVAEWAAFRHRREAIFIIRQRRHRLANQLQLVTGWLQLGAVQKAEEAMERLMIQEASQSRWFRHLPSHWSYLFLRWDARGEERGVVIRWSGLDTLAPSYRMAWILERRLREAIRMAQSTMTVDFAGEGFRIVVADAPRSVPRGWTLGPDGVAISWPSRRNAVQSTSEQL
ncbi:Spo0B domain-containing protein [Sulfobacillus harzensis]|uniref:Spo0B domain-containing protein n=1 Tax=Sulfobacillus harzensis TaxID=2729629 RepID=UPI0030845C0D